MHTMTFYICECCNSEFNQPQIESIGKKSFRKFRKAKLEFATHWATI